MKAPVIELLMLGLVHRIRQGGVRLGRVEELRLRLETHQHMTMAVIVPTERADLSAP